MICTRCSQHSRKSSNPRKRRLADRSPLDHIHWMHPPTPRAHKRTSPRDATHPAFRHHAWVRVGDEVVGTRATGPRRVEHHRRHHRKQRHAQASAATRTHKNAISVQCLTCSAKPPRTRHENDHTISDVVAYKHNKNTANVIAGGITHDD